MNAPMRLLWFRDAKRWKKIYTLSSSDKKFSRTWHTKRKTRNCGRAENENLFRGVDGWIGRAKTSFYHWWNGTRTLPIKR